MTFNPAVEDSWRDQHEATLYYLVGVPKGGRITHVAVFALDVQQGVALRVESVSQRVDIQAISCYEMLRWIVVFHLLGWPVVPVEARYAGRSTWVPMPFTCVELCKRVLGAPWWILTPNQLLRWARRRAKWDSSAS